MFNKYYQDELTYLRQLGQEFAAAYPQVGHMLAESGTDPDVERLLEGFAFLTGRVRQRLDSELPELTHAFVGLLWPHYLRPLPAMTIIQFEPSGSLQDRQIIPAGAEIDSTPVEGTNCRFRTTTAVDLYPFTISKTTLDVPLSKPAVLTLGFALSSKANLADVSLGRLRLCLHGEAAVTNDLYHWLCRHARAVVYRSGDRSVRQATGLPRPVGFDPSESMLPYPPDALPGYRLLQEYFAFPEKFLFVDLPDIAALHSVAGGEGFEIAIEFDQHPPERVRVKQGMIRIGCSPAVNLQPVRSAPIRVEHDKTEYRLRADATNPQHFEIFSVDHVSGWTKGTVQEHEYHPFFSYEHRAVSRNNSAEYYQLRLRPAVVGSGTETYLSFVSGIEEGVVPPTETVVADLTCTNRNLCEKLRPGDIHVATSNSPAFATFTNLGRITASVPPPLEGRLLWQLVSHMSLNYVSLMKVETLRGMLSLYNFHALVDRQAARANDLRLAGIMSVRATPEDLLRHGATYRGVAIHLDLKEDSFTGEGEMYLFSSVLSHFLNLYATVNCFTRLTVRGTQHGGVVEWPPMLGQQALL